MKITLSNIFIKNKITISLLTLMAIGFVFRIHKLGYYSLFASDDALTALAIKNIVYKGYSAFPSGLLYPKELFFSYPTAWICKIFGINEFTLRIFNLPFSIALIPLIYILGKELYGKGVGLLSAGIITFATWQLEFTRYVRSYILVQFLFILSVYLFFRVFIKEEKISKLLVFSIFTLAIFTSFLGSMLLMTFLSLWLIKGKRAFKPITIVFFTSYILVIIGWLQIYGSMIDPFVMNYSGNTYTLSAILQKITLPQFVMLAHLTKHYPVFWYSLLFVFFFIFLYFARQLTFKKQRGYYLTILALSLFCLPELAALVIYGYTILNRNNTDLLKRRTIITSLSILSIGIIFWFFYGLFFWGKPVIDIIKQINIFKFPPLVYYFYFFKQFPAMSLMVIIGLLLLYLKGLKEKGGEAAIFLSSLFIGSIIFMPFPINHSLPRYNFPIYPLFILIYVFSVIEIARRLAGLIKFKKLAKNLATISSAAILLLSTLEHATPQEAWRLTNLHYGQPVIHPYLATSPYLTHYFDYKSAANFVKVNLKEGDLVLTTFERLVPYFYIGQVDYNIYFYEDKAMAFGDFSEKAGPGSDPYLESGGICSLARLKEFIKDNLRQNRRIWLITPNYTRLKDTNEKVVKERLDLYQDFFVFLNYNPQALAYVAQDNLTEVYEFNTTNFAR
ncbi:MAG: glycosyltransferase family 39 protein [Candidatus Omnitrophica bacterium]|nr:glycosyltransferase family 39 protein [Candidatus Omnitrophota bacterium]